MPTLVVIVEQFLSQFQNILHINLEDKLFLARLFEKNPSYCHDPGVVGVVVVVVGVVVR